MTSISTSHFLIKAFSTLFFPSVPFLNERSTEIPLIYSIASVTNISCESCIIGEYFSVFFVINLRTTIPRIIAIKDTIPTGKQKINNMIVIVRAWKNPPTIKFIASIAIASKSEIVVVKTA